ncbi:uncharacterized protein [Nicotiana tomentosiformis]|uniref:uncharacterized protein n=1 Tax=Nicotiana tomentosiformis TaxID=4098 RepID=UPI00388C5308
MEAIRILIAFISHLKFKLFRMDVKSAFMNGYLKEEVFVKQPPGFECHEHPEHVNTYGNYRIKKQLMTLQSVRRMMLIFAKLVREPGSRDSGNAYLALTNTALLEDLGEKEVIENMLSIATKGCPVGSLCLVV